MKKRNKGLNDLFGKVVFPIAMPLIVLYILSLILGIVE
jgi:hypothetical protein